MRMSRTPLHAGSLRRLFRHLLAAAIVAPLPLAAVTACTSGTGDVTDYSGIDGGDSGPVSKGVCRTEDSIDAPRCGSYSVRLVGDLDTCGFNDGGAGTTDFCLSVCGSSSSFCNRETRCTNSSCAYFATCKVACAVDGRRYVGLDDRAAPAGDTMGGYLARMAFFEAASVDAFALLADDLAAHDAPKTLIRACRVARHDEVRHARMARTLAKRHGGVYVAPPVPARTDHRNLEALATENAVEGCVRETFGVLIGMWQAEAAPTALLRAFFAAVTQDEMRHAALSMRIDVWLRSRLAPDALERVDAARMQAVAALEASFCRSEPPAGLGLPTGAQARALLSSWRSSAVTAPSADDPGQPSVAASTSQSGGGRLRSVQRAPRSPMHW